MTKRIALSAFLIAALLYAVGSFATEWKCDAHAKCNRSGKADTNIYCSAESEDPNDGGYCEASREDLGNNLVMLRIWCSYWGYDEYECDTSDS